MMFQMKNDSFLPTTPGIYLFYNQQRELIYVGKATSLRDRVRSYFSGKKTSRPIEEMIHEVADIQYKQTDTVLEAVILESLYIKKYQPRYNVLGKDNKSWNYIVITKDEYPRIETLREHEHRQLSEGDVKKQYVRVFGPYPGLNTKAALKLLRRLFRFSTCQRTKTSSNNAKKPINKKTNSSQRPCLYYQMGQCLGVCTKEITPKEYKEKVIRPLTLFLSGRKKQLIKNLEQQMKTAAKEHQYEDAALYRDQLKSLYRIHDVVLLNKSFFTDTEEESAQTYMKRIEGYDISNLGASGKVGSMVVFEEGEPNKQEYRRFKIRTVAGQSDVDCLEEVLRRRFLHPEWSMPSVILIDGGLPQVNRAKRVLEELDIRIPIVGIAKGSERKRNDLILGTQKREIVRWVDEHKQTLIRVRDEAHRFALRYQQNIRSITPNR